MDCPRCQKTLESKTYEDVHIDACSNCNGAWLDEGEIVSIVEEREKSFSSENISKTVKGRSFTIPKAEKEHDLNCPKCSGPMKSMVYGADSGIIIDRCAQGDGLWFDANELEKVQMYREHWEKEALKKEVEWLKMAKSVKTKKDPYKDSVGPFKLLVNLFYPD